MTNPPYGWRNSIAVRYSRHALNICSDYVALLLTAKFDSGVTRTDLFRDNARFCGKVILLDRISFERNGKGGTEDHAWYIWHLFGTRITQNKYSMSKRKLLNSV